jgi:hypothetical protein
VRVFIDNGPRQIPLNNALLLKARQRRQDFSLQTRIASPENVLLHADEKLTAFFPKRPPAGRWLQRAGPIVPWPTERQRISILH